jgi:hypothetical protein
MVDYTLPQVDIPGVSTRQNQTNQIDYSPQSNDPRYLVTARVDLGGIPPEDVTVKEVIVGESLLNPSAHAVVTLQSAMYNNLVNWDYYRCKPIGIYIEDNNKSPNNPRTMQINQTIYRCDNRRYTNKNTGSVEELSLHSIDKSILNDAKKIWEKSWKCSTPGQVVKEALQQIGVTRYVTTGSTGPGRPYVAESIHPLQVIQQQANVALYQGDDPSFVHYMTIREQTGDNVHNFRALGELMSNKHTPYDIYAADTAISGKVGFSDAYASSFAPLALRTAITFNFPCDYDILSDILNGVDCDGRNLNDVRTINSATGEASSVMGAISQAANIFKSVTNAGTSRQQNSCDTNVEKYLLKRQARMGLLERDKIALRITLPWSPWLHVGQQIYFHWNNRFSPSTEQYGSGKYLILHMTHNIQYGGYAVTTLDCIANTFGRE